MSVDETVNHSLQFDPIGVIESATFRRWIRSLKDRAAVARINARLRNVSRGNPEDTKAVAHGLSNTPHGWPKTGGEHDRDL